MLVEDRVRAVTLLLVTACHQAVPSHVRLVPLDTRPSETRTTIAERAERVGMKRLPTDDDTDRYTFDRDPIVARVLPHRGGSLLELAGDSEKSLDLLATGGTTYHAAEARPIVDPWHLDLTVDLGYAHAPNTDAWWRGDLALRGGRRVWARGGETSHLETRRRLSVTGGLGVTYDERPALRPEVGVMFDAQDEISPIAGRRITQSTRKAVSLAFAVPIGEDHVAYEGSLTLHLPPHGGVFGRVGYELGERSGVTYSVGARLDGGTTLGLAGGALALALLAGGLYALVSAAGRDDPSSIR